MSMETRLPLSIEPIAQEWPEFVRDDLPAGRPRGRFTLRKQLANSSNRID
jgi:hypothetical protein